MNRPISRQTQMYGLLALAFAFPVVNSFLVFSGLWHPGPATRGRLLFKITYEITSLSALAYVLWSQKRRFTSIGLSFAPRFSDLLHSALLFGGAILGNTVGFLILRALSHWLVGSFPTRRDMRSALFGGSVTLFAFVFTFVNPFFEELLVRAFLITEVEAVFASTSLAALASIVLQTTYHLYQGIPAALALSCSFTLFTWYFVRKRRILPVILAHLYMDLTALLLYAHSLR
jgi:membrane protease YdiL (CAAX protease family)